jgi:hypothetical protein
MPRYRRLLTAASRSVPRLAAEPARLHRLQTATARRRLMKGSYSVSCHGVPHNARGEGRGAGAGPASRAGHARERPAAFCTLPDSLSL